MSMFRTLDPHLRNGPNNNFEVCMSEHVPIHRTRCHLAKESQMFVQAIRKLPVYTGRCWITRVDPPLQRCLASLSLVFVQLMKLDLRTFVFLDVIVVKVIILCEGWN